MSSEELLGVVSAPADDSSGMSGMAPCDGACGELRVGGDSCQGSPTPQLLRKALKRELKRQFEEICEEITERFEKRRKLLEEVYSMENTVKRIQQPCPK